MKAIRTACLLLTICAFARAFAAEEAATPSATSEIEQNEHYKLGLKYFETKDFVKAYDEFFLVFKEHPGSFNVNFQLGRAAFEKGDYEAAVMAYDRILTINPEMPRVKLELARSYYMLGSYELARQYFNEVLATNPPEKVKMLVENFIKSIELKKKRHFFNGMLSLNTSYDDNVRSSSENNTVKVPALGANTTLATGRDAITYGNTLVLTHKYRFSKYPWAWKTTGVNLNTWYNEGERGAGENGLDLSYLSLSTGPSLELNRFIMDFPGAVTTLEQDNKTYLKSYSFGVNMTVIVNSNLLLTTGLKQDIKTYCQSRNKDAKDLTLSFSPVIMWGKNRLTLKTSFGGENTGCNWKNGAANTEYESYTQIGASIRYDRQLPWQLTAYGQYRFENTDYSDTSILFLRPRRDNLHEFSVGLTKRISSNISAELGYTHSKEFSNIGLYRYDRDVAAFSLSYSF